LYDEEIASMDVHGGYDQSDASGFIKLNALRLKRAPKGSAIVSKIVRTKIRKLKNGPD